MLRIPKAALPTLLAIVAACLLPASARAGAERCVAIAALPAVITAPGVYCLRRTLSTSIDSGEAISIDAEDVTLDCDGQLIDGVAAGPDTQAVGILAARKHVTVRNCHVRGFFIGIQATPLDGFDSPSGNVIEDNHIDASIHNGIGVAGRGVVVRRNLVVESGGFGSYLWGGIGIAGNYDVEIVDNVVDGVFGTGKGGIEDVASGIWNKRGGVIARNRVRNLDAASVVGLTIGGGNGFEQVPLLAHDNLVTAAGGTGTTRELQCGEGEMILVRGDEVADGSGTNCPSTAVPAAEAVPGPAVATGRIAVATACKAITTLPAVITTRGVYCLAGALGTNITSGYAITIASDDVTLDCRDWPIDGRAGGPASTAAGVGAVQRNNIVVRGCPIHGFRDGIRVFELAGAPAPPRGVLVEGNRLHDLSRSGIVVNADAGIVRGNLLTTIGSAATPGTGIQTRYSVDSVDNRVSGLVGDGAIGIGSSWNHGGLIAGNRISQQRWTTGFAGIRLAASSQNVTIASNAVLHTDAADESAVAIACSGTATTNRMRGNTVMGYYLADPNCLDAGGNIVIEP